MVTSSTVGVPSNHQPTADSRPALDPVLARAAERGITDQRPRIAALDVLRGLALCGILVPNFLTVAQLGYELDTAAPPTLANPSGWIELLANQRFFPIFSLLFGIGFTLFLESATRRGAPHPRVVLLRRLLVLLPLGVGHAFLHPGEALSLYAVFGLLVLLPSSWLPRRLVAAGGALGVVLALWIFQGGWPLIPGVLLVGSALARYGVVARMSHPTLRGSGPVFLAFAVLAGVTIPWHVSEISESWSSHSPAVTGLVMAGGYVTGTLVLLATPARSVLTAVLAPLGRMALTNYVTATFLMIGAGHLLDLPHTTTYTGLLLAAAAILVGQCALSALWLRDHRQGPLEWLWRRATWWGPESTEPAEYETVNTPQVARPA